MKYSKTIAKYKIFLDRSRMYLNYVQFTIMLKLLFSDINIESDFLFFVLLVAVLLLMIFIGYLDTLFGIRSREMENNSLTNPVLREIFKILKDQNK